MKKLLLGLTAFIAFLTGLAPASAQINGGKKILIVATNSEHDLKYNTPGWGAYFPEIVDFYSRMHVFGFTLDDMDIISPLGGSIPLYEDPFSLPVSDADEQAIRTKVQHTKKPSDVNAGDYNVIYYVGGISCLVDFPQTTDIGLIARSIYENGGIVAAVCDGISGLIPITLSNGKPLVEGINVTTNVYTEHHGIDIAVELGNKGGLVDQTKGIVSDKRVITGQDVRPVQVANEVLKLLNIRFPMSVAGVTGTVDKVEYYPNPATDKLHIALPGGAVSASYRIYEMTGRLVQEGNVAGKIQMVNVSSLAGGQYIVETLANNGLAHKAVVAIKDR